ncbi:MAG: acetoacetate--CoA ligase [Deltaproteobacteria bacterium]|nr:acetoacetate--CoA ligase [Deltaproteobacteria bacterium]
MEEKRPLWTPSEERVKKSNMTRFIGFVNRRHGFALTTYDELYRWSIDDIPAFWADMWDFAEIVHSRKYDRVVDGLERMPGAKWFPGAQLNFAENLLRYRDDRTALIFKGEASEPVRRTYAWLFEEVSRLARSLRDLGVKPGDRVVGFMPNMIETVVAMLAATSVGATWSSTSPDFGIKGVLDRFGQVQPKVLFAANGYSYNGKKIDSLGRVSEIVTQLPTIEKAVVVPYTEARPDIGAIKGAVHYSDFLAKGPVPGIAFEQLPFEHPLYIMYTSGTTGLPKCIVQSAGGILIHHMKELMLHSNVKRDDTVFYFTTCGWMMWNWLVSSLSLGAAVVLYDGSPFHPDAGALWKLAQDERINVFGTSAKYLAAVEAENKKPGSEYDLSGLKTILSTGSPLSIESFEYVYRDVKADVQLSSISGGSDINGCFALGNPNGPVYAGELQVRGLAMKVAAFDEQGKEVVGRTGELVCRAPSPSMPISFWNDPDMKKYRAAYFETYPNVWRHGDFVTVTGRGGVIMHGRSDATLNPGGVRIGTAEIYCVVETMPEIADSLVVGQDWDNDVRVVLFVKLREGVALSDELVARIKKAIRENTSPRHVPAKVLKVNGVPYTINMKKVELAVRNIIHGKPVTNTDALSNPRVLDEYRDIPELKT